MAFWTLSASGELWQHLAISSWRALIGFSIGGSLGLILGLISGLSRWGERLLDTSIQMLRNVPHLALIPLVRAKYASITSQPRRPVATPPRCPPVKTRGQRAITTSSLALPSSCSLALRDVTGDKIIRHRFALWIQRLWLGNFRDGDIQMWEQ